MEDFIPVPLDQGREEWVRENVCRVWECVAKCRLAMGKDWSVISEYLHLDRLINDIYLTHDQYTSDMFNKKRSKNLLFRSLPHELFMACLNFRLCSNGARIQASKTLKALCWYHANKDVIPLDGLALIIPDVVHAYDCHLLDRQFEERMGELERQVQGQMPRKRRATVDLPTAAPTLGDLNAVKRHNSFHCFTPEDLESLEALDFLLTPEKKDEPKAN